MENLLCGSSAENSTSQRPHQLQAGGSDSPPDEDPEVAGPCSSLGPGELIAAPTLVCLLDDVFLHLLHCFPTHPEISVSNLILFSKYKQYN